jgi:hypothetical protein
MLRGRSDPGSRVYTKGLISSFPGGGRLVTTLIEPSGFATHSGGSSARYSQPNPSTNHCATAPLCDLCA